MVRYMERKHRLEDVLTVAFIEQVKSTPARTMAQIRDGREPEWVKPILALGGAVFTGPPLWSPERSTLTSWRRPGVIGL